MNENNLELIITKFNGEILHPSLDIKDKILVLGFRYRPNPKEEKEIFVIGRGEGNLEIVGGESIMTLDGKSYWFEIQGRKLARLEERWAGEDLQTFLDQYTNLKAIAPSLKAVFEEIVKLTKRYIELERNIDYCLLAAWIIGTYFYPAFYAYPFLHIKAPKRSGKSQCLNLLSQLCFNAIKARPSLPALSDTVDSLRGTYLIDQADALERKGSEDLLDILADSYKKGGGKRRVVNFDKHKSRGVLEFETYSPKAFASIKELPEDLRDRCLVIGLVRSQKNFPDPDDNNDNWRQIRGELYKSLMVNYEFVSSICEIRKIEYRDNQEIVGRSLELWLPFEVVMQCFEVPEIINEAKNRFLTQYGFSEYEPSELEEEVIKALLGELQNKPEVVLTPKAISELVKNSESEIFSAADTPKQQAAKVGWAIKKFNLSSEKKPRTKEGMCYLFQRNKIEGIYRSYFKPDPELTSPTSSQNNSLSSKGIQV